MREFIGEQYLAAEDAEAAAQRADVARAAAEQLRGEGATVHYVRSIFIPEDETCLHLYRADSIGAVRAAAARASLRLERLTEAIGDSDAADDDRREGQAA